MIPGARMPPLAPPRILQTSSPPEVIPATSGKRYRHFPGRPGKFTSVLPWSRFNALLQEHCFAPDRLHLVMERRVVPPPTYRGRGVDGDPKPQLDPVKVNKLLRDGATLVVNAVEEMVEPVRELAESLQRSLYRRAAGRGVSGWGTTAGLRPGSPPDARGHFGNPGCR